MHGQHCETQQTGVAYTMETVGVKLFPPGVGKEAMKLFAMGRKGLIVYTVCTQGGQSEVSTRYSKEYLNIVV